MSPIGHLQYGWWFAHWGEFGRRERAVVALAGAGPDLDGLPLFAGGDAFHRYHHILFHNLGAVLGVLALAGLFFWRRPKVWLLIVFAFAMHVVEDFVTVGWDQFPWQPFNASAVNLAHALPNWLVQGAFQVTAMVFILSMTVWIYLRHRRTPLEIISPALDRLIVNYAVLPWRNRCPASGTVLDLAYDLAWGRANNGNVAAIANLRESGRTQRFAYDGLNRILLARTEATSGQYSWGQVFGYDPWGNLLSMTPTQGTGLIPFSVQVNNKNQFSTSGYTYDVAGNLTSDGSTWDAEGRIKATAGVTYTYDGDGKRVGKAPISQPNQPYQLYWYGTGSDPLTETDGAGSNPTDYVFFGGKRIARRDPGGAVHFYISDHLGSARIVTDAVGTMSACPPSGVVSGEAESDFYPFGGERVICDRLANHNYKFTGKERDTETGNDYFGARYYPNTLFRWLSPDPLLNSGRPDNPQTWNRYAYTLNNPLKFVDPTGLYEWAPNTCAADNKKCNKQYEQNQRKVRDALTNLQKARDSFKAGSKEYNRLNAALNAYGKENVANGVTVEFGAVKGSGAAETIPANNNTAWTVRFDTGKISGVTDWAVDAGHEGTHVDDFRMPMSDFMKQSPFSMEYRSYDTSAWTAQGLGAGSLSFSGNVIWNSSWAAVDRQTLRDKAITKEVVDHYPDHPETQPHNPLPN